MAATHFPLSVKTGEKDGKTYWDRCGVVFVNQDANGAITSIQVRHSMLPGVDMVAFAAERIIEAEVEARTGVAKGARAVAGSAAQRISASSAR